jgi:hypothetical protein
MNKILMAAALIAAMYGSALAQSTTPSTTDPGNSAAPQAPNAPATQAKPQTSQAPVTSPATGKTQSSDKPKIAPGSVIPVQLTKTVDAKKVKTGDEVVTKVTMDMKTQSGDVLVPKDTKVIGHVTAAQARNKEQKESQLAIAFDRAVTKDGNSMQLPMSIQAVIGQQQMNDNSGGGEGNEAPAAGGGGASGGMAPGGGGRAPGASSSASSAPAPTTGGASDTPSASSSRPPINGQTTGVVGISNLTLAPAAGGAQGSVLTSEKNNVKLESGTMLLLKVNQQ